MPLFSTTTQWHPEDIGACRVLVPESREERARRHMMAQIEVDLCLHLIAHIRELDPEMPLTRIAEAARRRPEEKH